MSHEPVLRSEAVLEHCQAVRQLQHGHGAAQTITRKLHQHQKFLLYHKGANVNLNTINLLVPFYNIHGRKREVLFFYFDPDTTRDLSNFIN
jgi:hypothetical protein